MINVQYPKTVENLPDSTYAGDIKSDIGNRKTLEQSEEETANTTSEEFELIIWNNNEATLAAKVTAKNHELETKKYQHL